MVDAFAEIRAAFLEEAAQALNDTEQCYLRLEGESDPKATLDEAFRHAHNIKGSARSVGFDSLADFTHKLESMLLKLKEGHLAVSASICNLLLRANDVMLTAIDDLRQSPTALVKAGGIDQELVDVTNQAGGAEKKKSEPVPDDYDPWAEADKAKEAERAAAAAAFAAEEEQEAAATPAAEAAPAASAHTEAAASPPPPPASDSHESSSGGHGNAGNSAASSQKVKVDESIRVSLLRLEKLMNAVGELTILESVFNQRVENLDDDTLIKEISELKKISREIQHISMSLRMLPVKPTFQKMQRIVRDTAQALGKEIKFEIRGEDTELDRTILEKLGDPLVHLIRNACDHGLEMPADRVAKGKPAAGNVKLSAQHRGSQMVIEVADDGNGLDAKKLIAKAIEKKIIKPNAVLSDNEAYNLIFEAGFSTKAQVTDLSGRGVGMDVVRTNIAAIGGEIQINTKLGQGSTFRILLPLTLAIIDGFMVRMGEERYVVPITQVSETVLIKPGQVGSAGGSSRVYELRGEPMPVLDMHRILKRAASKTDEKADFHALIVRAGNNMGYTLLVDEIMGQQQVVIKSLGEDLAGLRGVSGSTILGDGQPALILDVSELIEGHRTVSPDRGRRAARA
jgi:two-component system chemotaxis sensor kinase CheA